MDNRSKIVTRFRGANPDHHLWNNHGTWWCHYTVHHPDHTKQRKRCSLRTDEVQTARRRRDALLARDRSRRAPAATPR